MKGIIVVDMPECCADCDFMGFDYNINSFEEEEAYCEIKCESVDDVGWRGKPDWCPIRPMPERKNGSPFVLSPLLKEGLTDYEAGWNDCIDSIMGGGECRQEKN